MNFVQWFSNLTKSDLNLALSKIEQAKLLSEQGKMSPSVFIAEVPDGTFHVDLNYQPTGTLVGQTFHFDDCGSSKRLNNFATVIWIKN